jgi:hypothetical protein
MNYLIELIGKISKEEDGKNGGDQTVSESGNQKALLSHSHKSALTELPKRIVVDAAIRLIKMFSR